MATGDLQGNLYRLQTELRHAKFPSMDYTSLAKGRPAAFLPILHYMLCDFSRPIAELIMSGNNELGGKTDQKFLEGMYKVLRDHFGYIPRITVAQFFNRAFAEHKILLTIDVVTLVRKKHKQMKKPPRPPRSGQEGNKPAKKVLQDVSLPENFRPSHNSTLSTTDCTSPPPPSVQGLENTPAVKIVVVGETPGHPSKTAASCPPGLRSVEELDANVTPRATRRGVNYHPAGDASPPVHNESIIRDSELQTHPVIRELAVTAGELLNRVRTLEEQVDTLAIRAKESEQRKDAQLVLLENKVKMLEAQIAGGNNNMSSAHSALSLTH